jgi:hypothetical protein
MTEAASETPRWPDRRTALAELLARVRTEVRPIERALLELRCDACEAGWCGLFRFEAPRHRGLVEARALARALTAPRPAALDADAVEALRRCHCGAPPHVTQTTRATLLRPLPGAGATVGVDDAGALELWPDRGLARPVSDADFAAAAGRPFSLFDAWAALPLPVGALEPEPGLLLLAETDPRALTDRVSEAGPVVAVAMQASTLASGGWPPAHPLRAHLEGGGLAALVVRREALQELLEHLGRPAGSSIVEDGPRRLVVEAEGIRQAVELEGIGRVMAQRALTLGEACAHALADALDTIADALRRMADLRRARPEVRFVVEGDRAMAIAQDGLRGPPFQPGQLPRPIEERDVAFLCDPLPRWADPTRVCRCGAAATLQTRILARRDIAPGDDAPWELRTWVGDDGEETAVEALAAACDRHVRVPSRRQLDPWLTASEVEGRLEADRARAAFRVSCQWVRDEHGAVAVLVHGGLAASLFGHDGWIRGLLEELEATLDEVEAWALGPDGLCLLDPAFAEAERPMLRAATAQATGRSPNAVAPFALRRRIGPAAPRGRFTASLSRLLGGAPAPALAPH